MAELSLSLQKSYLLLLDFWYLQSAHPAALVSETSFFVTPNKNMGMKKGHRLRKKWAETPRIIHADFGHLMAEDQPKTRGPLMAWTFVFRYGDSLKSFLGWPRGQLVCNIEMVASNP